MSCHHLIISIEANKHEVKGPFHFCSNVSNITYEICCDI